MNERIVSDVFSVYEFLKDSIKVTKRSINAEMHSLHKSTLFFSEQKELMANKFEDVEIELDAIMILSLFASFERELRISIQAAIDKNTGKANPTLRRLASLITNSIERWTVIDMINAMEDVVDSETRSRAKQIYEYRNGVCQPTCRFSGVKVSRVLPSFSGLSHTTFSSSRFLTGRPFHRSGCFRFASSRTSFLASRIAADSPR